MSEKKKKRERWVVKVGSQMIRLGGAPLIRDWMEQVSVLRREHNIEIIWVSSGAIASAVDRTAFKKSKSQWKIFEKQALSAIGQPILMDLYNLALHATGIRGAQVLLTVDDLENKKRRMHLTQTLEQLLRWDVVPILNENDAVAIDEIQFGDNDSLSARVAIAMKAHKLVILTDVPGLFDAPPGSQSGAKKIDHIEKVTTAILKWAQPLKKTSLSSGGMFSKLQAAKLALKQKIPTLLLKGDDTKVLLGVVQGRMNGTFIGKKRKIPSP